MKIEDIKIGCKVKLVSTEKTDEHLGYDQYEMLRVGSVSEVVDFGDDEGVCENVELTDGYWYAVGDLELYTYASEVLSEIKVKLSLEDKEEVAKDILKIALQDLNVIISNAIEDLSDDKEEVEDDQPELDFSNEKLQTLFDEAIKEVIKEQMQDAISSLNKTAFNI